MSSGQWPRSASPLKGLKQRKTPDTTPGFFNTLFKLFRRGHNAQRQKINIFRFFVMSPVLGTRAQFWISGYLDGWKMTRGCNRRAQGGELPAGRLVLAGAVGDV